MKRTAVLAALASFACGPLSTGCSPHDFSSTGLASGSTTASGSGHGGAGGGSTGAGGEGQGGTGGAAPRTTAVLVRDQLHQPLADVKIVVNDAEGAVSGATSVTDAAGSAQVELSEGGSVSAFYAKDLNYQISVVYEPPDVPEIAFQFDVFPPPSAVQPTTYSIYPGVYPAGTATLELSGTCASETATPGGKFPNFTNSACVDAQQDFLFVARSANQSILGWGALLNVPTSPGAILDFSVTATDTTFSSVDMTIEDIPPSAADATILAGVTPNLEGNAFIAAQVPALFFQEEFGTTLTLPAIPNAMFVWQENVTAGDGIVGSALNRLHAGTQLPVSTTFSAGSFTWISVNPLDVSDAEHPRVTWSSSKQCSADLVTVDFYWMGGTSSTTFSAILPPNRATSVRLPDIPDELAAFRPAATSSFKPVNVVYKDYDALSGFADAVDGYDAVEDQLKGLTSATGFNAPQ